jgi:hypothetical protein
MVSNTHGQQIRDTYEGEGVNKGGQVDFTFFHNYVPSDLQWSPQTEFATFDIHTPFELKYKFPMGVANYNPFNTDAVTGDRIAIPQWDSACTGAEALADCSPCFDLPMPWVNPTELEGAIVLVPWNRDNCWALPYELLYLTQNVGGVAVLFPVFGVDKGMLPFNTTVPIFFIEDYLAGAIYSTIVSLEQEVTATLPAIENGRMESFTYEEHDFGALPDTRLVIELVGFDGGGGNGNGGGNGGGSGGGNGNGSGGGNGNGGETLTMDVLAGQSHFNPESYASGQYDLVRVDFHGSCADASAGLFLEDESGFGQSCTQCDDLTEAGEVILNANEIRGKVVFVDANETFCFNDWQRLTETILAATCTVGEPDSDNCGVYGIVIANTFDHRMTLTDIETMDLGVPTFNIRHLHGRYVTDFLEYADSNPDVKVEITTPRITDGVGEPAADDGGVAASELGLAFLLVELPYSEPYAIDAGQALFNPDFSNEVLTADVVWMQFNPFCDGGNSCLQCALLNNAFWSRAEDVRGKVAVIEISRAVCLSPVYNYVLMVQELGAVGVVLFLPDKDVDGRKIVEPITLGPDILESNDGDVVEGSGALFDWFFDLELGDVDDSSVESLTGQITIPTFTVKYQDGLVLAYAHGKPDGRKLDLDTLGPLDMPLGWTQPKPRRRSLQDGGKPTLKLSLPQVRNGEAEDAIMGLVVLDGNKVGVKPAEDDATYNKPPKVIKTEKRRTIIAVSVVCGLLGTGIIVFAVYRIRRRQMLFAYNRLNMGTQTFDRSVLRHHYHRIVHLPSSSPSLCHLHLAIIVVISCTLLLEPSSITSLTFHLLF